MLGIITYIAGYGIGTWVGVSIYFKTRDWLEERRRKKVIKFNTQNGKQSCSICLHGITEIEVSESIKETINDVGIAKCYLCNCDQIAKLENGKWILS
jgi:hypothetical protein